jgi:hypothetical protein
MAGGTAQSATPAEKFDMTEPSSEGVRSARGCGAHGRIARRAETKFLTIIRSDNGKFFGFGESDVPSLDQMKGRFAQILPPEVPDDEMGLLAETMLKVKGVTPARREGSRR